MKKQFTQEKKQELVSRYQSGESVKVLCAEVEVSKSSLYEWIKLYQVTVTPGGQRITPWGFEVIQRRVQKLEAMLAVLQAVGCGVSAPLQDKLREMERLHGQFSVHILCEAMNVPRGTFYNHMFRSKRGNSVAAMRREVLRIQIREIFEESRQLYGAGKIRAVLMDRGEKVSEKFVAELMREMGIISQRNSAKRDYERMRSYKKKENVLKRQFQAEAPNRAWVSDVTCFRLKDRWYYICVILDLFSRKVIAYYVAQSNSTRLITTALKLALAKRCPDEGLIFHSDQGTQYTAYNFRKLLAKYNITQSLSKPGTPHDNAVAEATFKKEELYRTNYRSEQEMRKCIAGYMVFYNDERPHGTLHYKTPSGLEMEYWNGEDNT